VNIRFHPLRPGEFPERTRPRKSPQFKVGWNKVLQDLERELEFLGASEVVLSVGLNDSDIRMDGWPRANVHPWHPGIIISFDSKHGPLRYLCDEYEQQWYGGLNSYQANLRAISLGLEALRAVDRYGITRRGEQYTGWKQLAAGDGPTTVEQAAQIIRTFAMKAGYNVGTDDKAEAIRKAMFAAHPDHGGTDADFDLVNRARKILANN
jgi:hypothetical protein